MFLNWKAVINPYLKHCTIFVYSPKPKINPVLQQFRWSSDIFSAPPPDRGRGPFTAKHNCRSQSPSLCSHQSGAHGDNSFTFHLFCPRKMFQPFPPWSQHNWATFISSAAITSLQARLARHQIGAGTSELQVNRKKERLKMTKPSALPRSQRSFITDFSECTQGERITDKAIDLRAILSWHSL